MERQQIRHSCFKITVGLSGVHHNHNGVRRVLCEKLAASAAGHRTSGGSDGDRSEPAVSIGDRFEKGHAFGATCQSVACAFDVRSGDDSCRTGQRQCCADAKARVRTV